MITSRDEDILRTMFIEQTEFIREITDLRSHEVKTFVSNEVNGMFKFIRDITDMHNHEIKTFVSNEVNGMFKKAAELFEENSRLIKELEIMSNRKKQKSHKIKQNKR